MTRILQCLVWICIMTASVRSQRDFSYHQNQRSISFPDGRTHESYISTRHTNGFGVQLNKRGGQRPNFISLRRLLQELYAALGAIIPDSSKVVFPGLTSRAGFEPEIPEKCRKLGYCERISNYPNEHVKQLIDGLSDELRNMIQSDELDNDDVQIAQRFGNEGHTFGLCDAEAEKLLVPDSLRDKEGNWWTVLQDRDNNKTQGFKVEICRNVESSCSALVTFPPGYTNKCVQKFGYRSVVIVKDNKAVAQRSLRLPTCCSCMLTAP